MCTEDALADAREVVRFLKVFLDEANRLDQVARQQDLQVLKTSGADAAAQADNAALARAGLLREFGDRHADHVLSISLDIGGYPPRGRRKIVPRMPNAGEHAILGNFRSYGRGALL